MAETGMPVHAEALINEVAVASNRVDQGAKAVDVVISEQTAVVEELQLEVEAPVKQPMHNSFKITSPSKSSIINLQQTGRRCTILSRSRTTKAIMRHKIARTLLDLRHFPHCFASAKSSALVYCS